LMHLSHGRVRLDVPGYATVVGGQANSFYEGRPYYFFHNLKYAEAPVGERRFLPPEPKKYEEGTELDAWTVGRGCPQDEQSEDCLIVDIDTPYLPVNGSDPDPDTLLPVMFWIHGGSFDSGEISYYFGYKLMDHDVVLVEVQYRLSALGWLSLDIDEVPGNAGAFDMIEALIWVQKYIKYFGGDPNRVTIFGESAGGASVSTLMLAPQSRGLFRGVIAHSGSMLADWALDRDARRHGLRIAELAGCPLEPENELVQCLRTVDAQTLLRAEGRANNEDRRNGGLGFTGCSPVIQRAGKERMLEREPRLILEDGEYDTSLSVFMGANQQEGIYVLGVLLDDYIRPNNLEFDEEFMTRGIVPAVLNALGVRDDTGALADVLVDKYLNGFQLGNFTEMIPGLIDLTSVFFLKAGGWQTVIQHAKHNPRSYWYSYDFRTNPPLSLLGAVKPIPVGINHADELPMIFLMNPFMTEKGTRLSKQMLQLWTNFATYGELTPEGVDLLEGIPHIPPYNRRDQWYVSFTNDGPVVLQDYTKVYTVTGDQARPQRKKFSWSSDFY